jgi:hypothetical protein
MHQLLVHTTPDHSTGHSLLLLLAVQRRLPQLTSDLVTVETLSAVRVSAEKLGHWAQFVQNQEFRLEGLWTSYVECITAPPDVHVLEWRLEMVSQQQLETQIDLILLADPVDEHRALLSRLATHHAATTRHQINTFTAASDPDHGGRTLLMAQLPALKAKLPAALPLTVLRRMHMAASEGV